MMMILLNVQARGLSLPAVVLIRGEVVLHLGSFDFKTKPTNKTSIKPLLRNMVILRDTFFFFPSGSKYLEQIWPTTTRAIWSSFPLFNTLLQGLSCVIISQGSLTAMSFPPRPLSSRSVRKLFTGQFPTLHPSLLFQSA